MEKCEMCGKRYEEVYDVPDWMWKKVTGKKNGSGLLCMSCFDIKARANHLLPYWTCDNRKLRRYK